MAASAMAWKRRSRASESSLRSYVAGSAISLNLPFEFCSYAAPSAQGPRAIYNDRSPTGWPHPILVNVDVLHPRAAEPAT